MKIDFEQLKKDIDKLQYKQLGKIITHMFEGWEYEKASDNGIATLKRIEGNEYISINIHSDGTLVNLV